MTLYIAGLFLVTALAAVSFYLARRRKFFASFTTTEIVTLALFICLMFVATLPWKVGLRKLPLVHAFLYTIPYTAVFITGVRLVPKPGAASLIVFGSGLLGQLLGQGINPLWWPYFLVSGFVLELFFLLARSYARSAPNALGAGALRGAVCYGYFYFVAAPFIWHKFYPLWYVSLELAEGVVGGLFGAWLGWLAAKTIERAFRHGGL